MNQNTLISQALDELAGQGVCNHANPWPKILAKLQDEDKIRKPAVRLKISRALLIVLIALLVVTAAGYAFYRIMIDPGLQAVQDAGLVTENNQTAQPTLFTRQTGQSGILADTATPSIENLQVNLIWSYADETRVAFQIAITGLSPEQTANLNNYVCTPYITNDSGVSIGAYLANVSVHADQPWNPVDLTYLAYQSIDASEHPTLDLSLDLTVGPCGPYWNFDENNLPAMTPYPVFGNYHLNFRVPVYRGASFSPGQTIKENGVEMRLDKITLNPSYVDLQLCYQAPAGPQFAKGSGIEWALDGVTLDLGGGEPIPMGEVLKVPARNSQGEICETVGYAVPAPANSADARMVVHVARLVAVENEGDLTDQFKADAKEKLAQQGIEVDFNSFSPDSGHLWMILKKPSGMTAAEADQAILGMLTHIVEGPWDFDFTPTP